jgi:hypothetical protein
MIGKPTINKYIICTSSLNILETMVIITIVEGKSNNCYTGHDACMKGGNRCYLKISLPG